MADYVSYYSGDQIDEAVRRAIGFGLGDVQGKTINSLDEITGYGFYRIPTESGIAPDTSSNWGAIYIGSNIRYGTLIASRNNQGLVLQAVAAGVWGEFEWVNPPMQLGVEYRTTERYNGKPVYAKLVNFGALPNASNKSVAHNLSNPLAMVDGKITDSNGSFVTNYNIKNFAISTANIIIETEADMSGVSASILLKYTKTTD